MTRWEYLTWDIEEPHTQEDYDTLDGYGREGWEAYAVTTREHPRHGATIYVYHLRRPVETAPIRSVAGEEHKG